MFQKQFLKAFHFGICGGARSCSFEVVLERFQAAVQFYPSVVCLIVSSARDSRLKKHVITFLEDVRYLRDEAQRTQTRYNSFISYENYQYYESLFDMILLEIKDIPQTIYDFSE